VKEELAQMHNDGMIGKTLADRYQILSLISEGGMGLIYKARHVLMDRIVAIKLIRSELITNKTLLQRFHQEAQAVSKLDHPNIVTIYDYGVTSEGAPYLVMDYLQGHSLADLLSLEDRMSVNRALPLFKQTLKALKHAHDKGIIHRDMKASNLMICYDESEAETVKVVDFGMAKLVRPESAQEFKDRVELTKTGEVFGSPLYMSPEQCRGRKLDVRSDLYSLACVMYYALSGRPPFLGDNALDTLQKQISEQPHPPSKHNPDISPQLDAIVLKALSKDPDLRYQHAQEFLTDLEALDLGTEPQKTTAQMRKPVLGIFGSSSQSEIIFSVVIGFTMIALVAFASGHMMGGGDAEQDVNLWVDHNLEGNRAMTRHDYAVAQRYYKEAVTEAVKFGKSDPRLAKSLVLLGEAYAGGKQYVRAESSLKRAMDILEKSYGDNCFEESSAMLALVEVYEREGRHDEAQELNKRALAAMQSAVGQNRGIVVQSQTDK
jgi:serine/threonine protein kinase